MRFRFVAARLFLATSLCALATAAPASETVTYRYDALGRLVATSSSGSVNNGLATGIAYDPAGNRSGYSVSGGPVPNRPPVAVADGVATGPCGVVGVNVLDNDSDPDGDALTLVAVTGATLGTTYFTSTMVEYHAGTQLGTDTLTYTVRDSHGATATATLTVYIVNPGWPTCP
jgi:YD repeat-containing protein